MDSKYGRIFTEDEVRSMIEAARATGHDYDTIVASRVEEESGKFGGWTFPEGMPIFVLVAKDKVATGIIDEYGLDCENRGCDKDHVENVAKAVESFREWQEANPDLVKLPD